MKTAVPTRKHTEAATGVSTGAGLKKSLKSTALLQRRISPRHLFHSLQTQLSALTVADLSEVQQTLCSYSRIAETGCLSLHSPQTIRQNSCCFLRDGARRNCNTPKYFRSFCSYRSPKSNSDYPSRKARSRCCVWTNHRTHNRPGESNSAPVW